MSIALSWRGPVGPGLFPTDSLAFERLCTAGVYLRVKRYGEDRLVCYAGQSVSLLARFDQHVTAMLSLAAPLRDDSGAVVFAGTAEERFAAYGDLDAAMDLAAGDVARVRFWYALCDAYFHQECLSLVEGLLQQRLKQGLSGGVAEVENAVAAPSRVPDDVPDRWDNDYSELDADSRAMLERLLGSVPMRLPAV